MTTKVERAPVPAARSRYTLGLLLVIFISGHVDRNILNVFIEPIKAEFGLSDLVMGLLTGLAFGLFYTLAGIPIARAADRGSRKWIIIWGLTLWSAMTALQAFVRAFWQLALARVMVGVGEATISPSSHSIIADLYPPERRALPLGIYSLGGHVGMLIGFAMGGLLAETFGWRVAFVVVGLPGLALALVAWATLDEPLRGQAEGRRDEAAPARLFEVLAYLVRLRSFRNLALSAAIFAGVAGTFNIWGVAFMQRVHGLGLAEAGLRFGLVTGIPGILGTIISSWLVDRLVTRDPRWATWIPVVGGVSMVPFSVGFVLADDPNVGLAFYGVQVFLSTFWMGPAFSMAQGLARLRMRSTAAALFLLVINVIGLMLFPAAVGAMSDAFSESSGNEGLRYALLVLALSNLWGALHSLRVGRTLRADLEAAVE